MLSNLYIFCVFRGVMTKLLPGFRSVLKVNITEYQPIEIDLLAVSLQFLPVEGINFVAN